MTISCSLNIEYPDVLCRLPDLRILPAKDGKEAADAMCNIVKVWYFVHRHVHAIVHIEPFPDHCVVLTDLLFPFNNLTIRLDLYLNRRCGVVCQTADYSI